MDVYYCFIFYYDYQSMTINVVYFIRTIDIFMFNQFIYAIKLDIL